MGKTIQPPQTRIASLVSSEGQVGKDSTENLRSDQPGIAYPLGLSAMIRGLTKILLFDPGADKRKEAAAALGAEEPSPEGTAALVLSATSDPTDEVRQEAQFVLKRWAAAPETAGKALDQLVNAAREAINQLMTTACNSGQCAKQTERIFCFGNMAIRVTLSPMTSLLGTKNREQRIDAVVERIQEAVAVLPDDEEQREAEVKALVTSVPPANPYPDQLRAFTGITHVMRVMMARQLEPRFREYLRDDSPRADLALSDDRKRQDQDLASRKTSFTGQVTEELFRLGLALKWRDNDEACYLTTLTERIPCRTRYRIMRCGEGEQQVGLVTNWREDRRKRAPDEIDRYLNQVGLVDAAPPGKRNPLSPTK